MKPRPRTVNPPIERGSTVLLPSAAALYSENAPTYGRMGLATHAALAEALAEMEGAREVHLFPSGQAAIAGALGAVLEAGDQVLLSDAVYKPTRRFADNVLTRFGVAVAYYPPRATPRDILAMASPSCRLVMLESPGSLSFEMQDVAAIAQAARARGVLTLMDNTWAAGFLFKPLGQGVDISVQALTKYVAGHSDVFLGSAASRDPRIGQAIEAGVRDCGWAVGAEDAYLALRGLRTLPARLERHGRTALSIAKWLERRDEVTQVLFPPLPGAPDHDLWTRDYTGACGLMGVVLAPASKAQTLAFLDALKVFGLGFSWGGFESLAIWSDPQLAARHFPPRFPGPLIRLAIGLEDEAAIRADLEAGFTALARAGR